MDRITNFIADYMKNLPQSYPSDVKDKLLQRHNKASINAIIRYGSVLRQSHVTDTPVDYFIIASTYKHFHPHYISAAMNYLLPPNVYFLKGNKDQNTFLAKYNVITSPQLVNWLDFEKTPFFWIRLCQPCYIDYCVDEACRQELITSIAKAHKTAYLFARQLPEYIMADQTQKEDPLTIWKFLFRRSYASELRNESIERIHSIVDVWEEYYNNITPLLEADFRKSYPQKEVIPLSRRHLFIRSVQTKIISFLRLIKARITSGATTEYIIWKLERHSKMRIALSPWQKKIPFLGRIITIIKLYMHTSSR